MKEMAWSYNDLLETPYERYLELRRIVNIEKKEEKRQTEKTEREMEKKT